MFLSRNHTKYGRPCYFHSGVNMLRWQLLMWSWLSGRRPGFVRNGGRELLYFSKSYNSAAW
jgi:hypothetical protein